MFRSFLENKRLPERFALVIFLTAAVLVAQPGVVNAQKRIHSAYYEGTDFELNVYKIYGKEPGKTLLLIGGIQGDEPGGYLSVDHYVDLSLLKGNLIVVPRANFRSIVLNRRKINDDMNRKFADDSRSNYEAKIVSILKKLIAESDCLLNLHDGSGFYSEKWEGPDRNPKRYGQSIISDCDVFEDPKTGRTLHLGDMARSVCKQVNRSIRNPRNHFRFNNHKTRQEDSLHKEQRKSATYYALNTFGIPAFGIETSKSLPLEQKVRHHSLAINAFMQRLGIVPETPGLNLQPPEFRYLIVSINDSPPVVVRDRQTLTVSPGDDIMISHIEANYERGMSVDISGYGTVNDIRKKIKIEQPTKIIVRKDYYPCGQVQLKLGESEAAAAAAVAVADAPATGHGELLFKVEINGKERIYQNYGRVGLVKGDKVKLVDVISGAGRASGLVVNLKGFVGDPDNNTGEDRGYAIDTGTDFWQRYSLEKKGKKYQVVVSDGSEVVGKLFLNLEDPVLKYIVLKAGDSQKRCLAPGETTSIAPGAVLTLFDVNTNVPGNLDVKTYVVGLDSGRRLIDIAQPVEIGRHPGEADERPSGRFRIEVERAGIFLGSINLNCLRETYQ